MAGPDPGVRDPLGCAAARFCEDKDPNHLALQGEGFFVVSANGRELLTRAGAFQRNEEGQLITEAGHPLMGEGGAIEIPPEEEFRVGNDGRVYGSESGELGKIKIVDAEKVTQIGGGLWKAEGPLKEANAEVIQGALEASNVDPIAPWWSSSRRVECLRPIRGHAGF